MTIMERRIHLQQGPSVWVLVMYIHVVTLIGYTLLPPTAAASTVILSTNGNDHVQLRCPNGYLLIMSTTTVELNSLDRTFIRHAYGTRIRNKVEELVYKRCFGNRNCYLDMQLFMDVSTNVNVSVNSVHLDEVACISGKYFYYCNTQTGYLDIPNEVDEGFIISNNLPMRSRTCYIHMTFNQKTTFKYYHSVPKYLMSTHIYYTQCNHGNRERCGYVIKASAFLLRFSNWGQIEDFLDRENVAKDYDYGTPAVSSTAPATTSGDSTVPTTAPSTASLVSSFHWSVFGIGLALFVVAIGVVISTIIVMKRRKLHGMRQETNATEDNICHIPDDMSRPTQPVSPIRRTTANTRLPAIPPNLETVTYKSKGTNHQEEIQLPSNHEADRNNYEVQMLENDLYVRGPPDVPGRESASVRIVENELYHANTQLQQPLGYSNDIYDIK